MDICWIEFWSRSLNFMTQNCTECKFPESTFISNAQNF